MENCQDFTAWRSLSKALALIPQPESRSSMGTKPLSCCSSRSCERSEVAVSSDCAVRFHHAQCPGGSFLPVPAHTALLWLFACPRQDLGVQSDPKQGPRGLPDPFCLPTQPLCCWPQLCLRRVRPQGCSPGAPPAGGIPAVRPQGLGDSLGALLVLVGVRGAGSDELSRQLPEGHGSRGAAAVGPGASPCPRAPRASPLPAAPWTPSITTGSCCATPWTSCALTC